MDNLYKRQALSRYLMRLLPKEAQNEDDEYLIDTLKKDEIQHACQAIRHTRSDKVTYQHLTLRFEKESEKRVYALDMSAQTRYCLDLCSITLALQQIGFQLETIHPDMIDPLVVPLQSDTLLWQDASLFIKRLYSSHPKEMPYLIPSIQLHTSDIDTQALDPMLEYFRENAPALWLDIKSPTPYLNFVEHFEPDAIKISQAFTDSAAKVGLLPIVKLIRRHNYTLVAGQVSSQNELNHMKKLGAKYYFGYISDIPTPISFKNRFL